MLFENVLYVLMLVFIDIDLYKLYFSEFIYTNFKNQIKTEETLYLVH